MIKDKVITKIFEDAANEFGLTVEQIEDIHNSWGLFIRRTIVGLKLREIEDFDDLDKLKTNFNIPYIGKLYTNKRALEYSKTQSELFNKRRTLNEEKFTEGS